MFKRSPKLAHSDDFFKTNHLDIDLKKRSVKGGTVTLLSQGIKFILQLGSTVILARLLSPDDYGLIGMTTVVTSFIQLFKDMGLSEATIQCREINHKQVSTLFWLNCLVGLALATLVFFIAPVVSYFYDEPRVIGIMRVLSINFIIGSIVVQHIALLKRQMQFSVLAQASVLAMILGIIVAATAAWNGLGYWALTLMFITTVLTESIYIWMACSWRPGMPDFRSGIGSMLSFGGNVVGFSCVNYFSRNLDNILIGRIWGPQALGLYAKAYQLVLLPINQINRPTRGVAIPTLSRLQERPEKYKRYYYHAILLITMVGMPIVFFLFVAADDVILLVLGEKWLEAVPIFRLLIPAALIGTFNVAPGWAFRSLGRADKQFKLGIFTSIINIIIFMVSVHWGVIGVAAAYGFSRPFMMIFNITYCYKNTFLKVHDLLKVLSKPALYSLISALFLSIISYFTLKEKSLWLKLLCQTTFYFIFYLVLWFSTKKNRSIMREILRIYNLAKE